MPWISGFVSLGLVWVFGLVVIFWFWWRSMPAHEPLLTLFLGAVLWVTMFVFGSSLAGAWTHLKFENHEAQRPVYWQWSVPLVFVAILGATLVRTGKLPAFDGPQPLEYPLLFGESICDWRKAKILDAAVKNLEGRGFAPEEIEARLNAKADPGPLCWRPSELFARTLATAELDEEVFTEQPKDWQGKEIAEIEFRLRWCKERGDPKCGNPLDPAKRRFLVDEEKAFQVAWKERWTAHFAKFAKPDLRGADFRRASLKSVSLEGAKLAGASLEDADLSHARLEGADFSKAMVTRAKLSDALLDGADLSEAVLVRAVLEGASLRGAVLNGTNLIGANLTRARLFGDASLSMDFTFAELSAANFRASALRFAILSADNLENAWDFKSSFGDASVELPEGISPPCQWGLTEFSDAEYFGRWEGWLKVLGEFDFALVADVYPPIAPPAECRP